MDNGGRPPEDPNNFGNGPANKPNDVAQGRPQVQEVFGDATVGGKISIT